MSLEELNELTIQKMIASEIGTQYINQINHIGQSITVKNEEWQKEHGQRGANTRGQQLLENNEISYKGGKARGEQMSNNIIECHHCNQKLKEVTYYSHNHHIGKCVEIYDRYVYLYQTYLNSGLSRAKIAKKLGVPPHHIQAAVNWYRKNSEWYLSK